MEKWIFGVVYVFLAWFFTTIALGDWANIWPLVVGTAALILLVGMRETSLPENKDKITPAIVASVGGALLFIIGVLALTHGVIVCLHIGANGHVSFVQPSPPIPFSNIGVLISVSLAVVSYSWIPVALGTMWRDADA